MQVIIEKTIKNKEAKLVLADDNVTVQVIYDNIVIDTSAGDTWKNLNGTGLEEGYLDVVVNSIIDEQSSYDAEFEEMKGELD